MDDPNLNKIENPEDLAREKESAEASIRRLERDQQQFRREFSKLDKAQKGTWGERVVTSEAENAGHKVLLGHSENPTEQGFDCASYDEATKTLHIWEVKNFGDKTGAVNSDKVTAFQDETKSGTKYADARPGYERNWQKVLDAAPDIAMRDAIKQSIAEGRVVFHIRLGPDTKISEGYKQELETTQVPGATYDWKQYAYADMLKVGSGR